MKAAGVTLAILLCLAGCGGGARGSASSARPASTVSLTTACQLLVDGETHNSQPFAKLLNFANAVDVGTEQRQLDKARGYVHELTDIAKRSPHELATPLNAMIVSANDLFDILANGGGTWTKADLKVAALDVGNQCNIFP